MMTTHHHQPPHHQQSNTTTRDSSRPSPGFGTLSGVTGKRSADDGGWSCGMPEKGSGWRGLAGMEGVTKGDGSGWKGNTSESAEAAGTLGWGESSSSNGLERSKPPNASGWFSSDSAPNRPSSIGAEGWGSKSTRQGPSPHSDKGVWRKSDAGGRGQTPSSQGASTLGPPEQKQSYENGTNGVSMWGANATMAGTNWKMVGPEGNADHHRSESMGGTYSPQGDEGVSSGKQEDMDMASLSSGDRDTHSHSQDSGRPITISPAGFAPPDNLSISSSGSNSRIGGGNDYQSSGNFSSSHDSHMTNSEEAAMGSIGYESPYSRISPRNGAGTPIQQGPRSGGATPTQGNGKAEGGVSTGENCWGTGRGSTSSVNSVGSSSSWKGDARNGVQRSNSPRKNSRFDRTNSTSQQDSNSDSNPAPGGHTPQLTSYGSSNILAQSKLRKMKPKTVHEYEEGLDSLQSEPSGWGELPSPRPSDLDNGTEFWGVPPADLERQRREKTRISHSSTSSSAVAASDMSWSEVSTPGSGGVDWEEDMISSGGMAGWGRGTAGPTSGGMEQGPNGGWGTFPGNKDKMSFVDNVMQLMEMGMNRSSAEKLLSSTHNNLEMAVLIAGSDNPTFDLPNSSAFPSAGSRKPHGKVTQNISSPFSSGNSTLGMPQETHPMQAMQNQTGTGTGMQSKSHSQNQNHQLKLLQMQQQYLLNQIPGTSLPTLPLNVQNYQQVLNQRLAKLQKTKIYLNQQLKILGPGGGGDNTTAHQINLKMQQNQQHIAQINQQLQVLAQISAQQNDPSPKPQELSSPMLGGPPPSSVPRGGGGMGKGFGVKQGAIGRSHSTSGIPEEPEDGKGLLYNMQGLSLGGGVAQSSTRSLSRLHQIFGSSSSSDSLTGMEAGMFSEGSQGSSPFSPPQGGGMGSMVDTVTSSGATPTSAMQFLPSGKPFSDIQEFKPGVPWQPRSQATEPAQLYSKQNSMPASSASASYDNFSVPQSPVYSNLQSPMIVGQLAPQSKGHGGKYMRSNSTGSGGFYGGGSGSGFMGSKRLSSPSGKYAHFVPEGGARQQGVVGGAGGSSGGWSSSSSGSLSSDMSYGGGGAHVQTRTYYPARNNTLTAQSPVSQFPPGVGGAGGGDRGWKQQKQHQLPNGRRVVPTSLPPRAMSAASGLHHASRSIGGTPLGTRDVFGTSHTPMSAGPTSLEDKAWGSALAMTPGALAPSPAVIPNSVWGSGTLATPDELSSMQLQNQWGKEDVSKIWNQTSVSDTVSSAPSKPPGLSVSPDSSPIYMKIPSEFVSTSSEGSNSYATTPSFSSGSSTWGQDEIKSSEVQKEMLSPEPTFAEWQAGKKARLSVFRLPSTVPTSPWLVLRNVTKQIDLASLREVCSEYGVVRVCHTHHPSELALICFNNIEEAIQAKTGLDKNPFISGVSVTAQFASEGDIKELCEQFQVSHNAEKKEERRGEGQGWPSHTSGNAKPMSMTPTPSSLPLSTVAATAWENHTPSPAHFSRQQSSEVSTPGSSMWGDGGFLSGFSSSPWLSSGPTSSTSMGGANTMSGGSSMTSPQEQASSANVTLSGTGQSFLPGGLL